MPEASTAPDACPRCQGPNECALAQPEADRTKPCWCVAERFPEGLLMEGDASACICRGCLARAKEAEPAP